MAFFKISDWLDANIPNFASSVKKEEDVKIKVLLPFLQSLGYDSSDMFFESSIEVQAGTKKVTVYADIVISINGNPEIIIDTKGPDEAICEKHILQANSYSKLISTPPAIFGVVTNGQELALTNIYSGKKTDAFPDKASLESEIARARKRELSEIEVREVNSLLLTLTDAEDLFKIIKKCKDTIEKKGLIRSDQSFKEMTKILLVKMNEEKRAKTGNNNRFQTSLIETLASVHKVSYIEEFKNLFRAAVSEYPIYSDPDTTLQISDENCVREVIRELEPWSFLGTGSDIKGAVYEIFLKSTLRGDFDQYFTPREIVDFIVKYANPEIGDVILDPACGSGGFLIQAFQHVNQKIINSPFSDAEAKMKFKELIDKCLWGGEADEDLHVLAKINLIMHGDGYNNIFQGDSLTNNNIHNDFYDLILTNPPFTIPYTFTDILSLYETGKGLESQELDILFVEKCIRALNGNKGGELFIVLPEGLLNLPCYRFFRKWLLSLCWVSLSVSLPEGAFIPFGKSVSKTCILGLRKKGQQANKPEQAFLCNAKEVGYEVGKFAYKEISANDLPHFIRESKECFNGIRDTVNGGECGWIAQDDITDYRIDANYLLNAIDLRRIHSSFSNLKRLDSICHIKHRSLSPTVDVKYDYLEIPDVSPVTGLISNIRRLTGAELGDSFYVARSGDLAYCRINPRKNRVFIIPEGFDDVLVSKETYILELNENSEITDNYVLAAILQSDIVRTQLIRLSTGSSSSRARVQEEDFLNAVYIPIPSRSEQNRLSKNMKSILEEYWKTSQRVLKKYIECQRLLCTDICKDSFRSI